MTHDRKKDAVRKAVSISQVKLNYISYCGALHASLWISVARARPCNGLEQPQLYQACAVEALTSVLNSTPPSAAHRRDT